MTYEANDFSDLIGMPGFSEDLLTTHFKLYEGYVTHTNQCLKVFDEARKNGSAKTPQVAEVRRRFGWEFNGMRLHEVYFGNLKNGGNDLDDGSALSDRIDADFGGFNAWKDEFSQVGAMRGIGWACLCYDPVADRLVNTWIDEHDVGHLATGVPIVLLDVFEHAFMRDYGTDKASYIDAFFKNLDWKVSAERFRAAQESKRIPLAMK